MLPATKPAAATIGVVPEATFMRLLTIIGVEPDATVIATVPVATTMMLLEMMPRNELVVTFKMACVILPVKYEFVICMSGLTYSSCAVVVDPVAIQNLRWLPDPHDVEVAGQDAVMLESVQPGIDITSLGVKGHDPA